MQYGYTQNLPQLHHEEIEWFLLRFSGLFIVNLEHVSNWVAVSATDNDQVNAAGKDINIQYIYIYIYIEYYIYKYIYIYNRQIYMIILH